MCQDTTSRRNVLAVGAAILGTSVAGCTKNEEIRTYVESDNWRFAHHDTGHTGYNPDAVGAIQEPALQWQMSIADGQEQYSPRNVPTPTVVDGIVYVGGSGVFAVDAVDGTPIWHTDSGTDYHGSAVADGVVYIGSLQGDQRDGTSYLHAFDTADGAEQWRSKIVNGSAPGPYPPIVGGSTVYGHAARGVVRAINADNGAVQWTAEQWGAAGVPPIVAIDTDSFYHYETARVKARRTDRTTLQRSLDRLPASEWSYAPAGFAAGWITVTDDLICVPGEAFSHGDNDGRMTAVETDGTHGWEYDVGARSSPPAVIDDTLYMTRLRAVGRDGSRYEYETTLVALDANSGEERWIQHIAVDDPIDTRPVATKEVVYLATHGNELHAVSTTDGEPLWTRSFNGTVGSIATVGEYLYVATTKGTLYALHASNSTYSRSRPTASG